MDNNNWFTIFYIEQQEKEVVNQFNEFFGKSRNGFCDYALNGIELILQGICHLTNMWKPDTNGEFKDFNSALRCFTYYHYERIFYTFKACYNLLLSGYYTEASILLRSIVETFVRLKFIEKQKNIEFIMQAFAGSHKYKGKKFEIRYEQMFETISPGSYPFYRLLCNISHGALASHILKITVDKENKILKPDDGIIFKPKQASFIINQFIVYLLGHLNLLTYIFPEIKNKMPEFYKEKLEKTLQWLNKTLEEFSKNEKNKVWIDSAIGIINVRNEISE